MLMIRIIMRGIVRIFCLFFICFMPLSYANLIIVIQIEPSSGGYAILQADPGSSVEFLERNFAVDETGFVAIGIGRDVAGLHEFKVISKNGEEFTELIWIESRRYVIQRINGVDQSRVTPPDSLTERIIREAEWVKLARNANSKLDYWRTEKFVWPHTGTITGVYGSERFYNGVPRSPHWGIDIAAAKGAPVLAPAGGKVVLAEADLYFSGGTIVLDHGGGLTSSFLHLSRLNVKVGDLVQQGQVIAAVGSTGRSTGPHLDWRMNLHGERIDASLWVR
jgi:murein DD-endopeptidase MepM/ murein hydrolase activator NlpD